MKYSDSDDSYYFMVLDKFGIEYGVEHLDYMNFLKDKNN